MTTTDIQALRVELAIKGAVVLLVAVSICATILLVILLMRYAKEQDQEHEERMASIRASLDMGQTAWAHTDVHKTEIIRQQAARIRRLEAWKAHTEENMKKLNLTEVLCDDVQVR